MVYGQGMEPIRVSVERRDLRHRPVRPGRAQHRAGPHGRRHGVSGDRQGDAASPGAPHRHPHRLPPGQPERGDTVPVPVRLEGEAQVLNAGGLVDPAVDTIEVVSTPRNIPNEFVIDISDMKLDTVIRLSDIPMPAGVTAVGDPDMAVVTVLVSAPRSSRSRPSPPRRREAEEGPRARGRGRGAEGDGGTPKLPASRRRRQQLIARPVVMGLFDRRVVRAPRSTGWSSGWATPARSTSAPATTSARKSSACSPNATATSSRPAATSPGRRCALGDRRVVLAFPITYMNESGQAGRRWCAATRSTIRRRWSSSTTSSTWRPASAAQGRRRSGRPQRAAQHHPPPQDAGLPAGADRHRQAALQGTRRRPRAVAAPQRERELLDVPSSRRPTPSK